MKWINKVEDENGNILRGMYEDTDVRGRTEIRIVDFTTDTGWKPGFKPQELIDKEANVETMSIFGGIL